MKKKKKGFSLIELILVLSIIISLSIVVFVTYSKLKTQNDTQTLISEVSLINASINELYPRVNANGYKGLTNQVLINSNLLSGTTIKTNPNGGILSKTGVTFKLYSPNYGDNVYPAYLLTMSNVTQDACIKLVTNFYKSKNKTNTLSINSNGIVNQPSIDQITTLCSDRTFGNKTNTVMIQFRN